MAISPIPVDQRVIDIDSRRFASVEKALVELITNADDSYGRLEQAGVAVSGLIRIHYERHQGGAALSVADQAEGMSFAQARFILAYGGAHSPLARGEGGGRGYFGRGLKQAIYGLGYGWIETLRTGRLSRIELFRDQHGGYLYDDGDGDRPARAKDHERLGAPGNGTRVTIVTDHPQVTIPHFRSLVQALAGNFYLRDVLRRRTVELVHTQHGKVLEQSGPVRYQEPPAAVLIGPAQAGQFVHEEHSYPFTLTLKRALDAELSSRGDERSNGLLVLSGTAVLDCQLFDYENQLGTEYLFGSVECPALLEKLGQGMAVISDEREGLNRKEPFVAAFARAVSAMIAPCVLAEREKLRHLEHASASGRTSQMIEHLLERMSRAAIKDLGLSPPPAESTFDALTERPAALRFSTPFYYRAAGHPFHVALLVDPGQLAADAVLRFEYRLAEGLRIDPAPSEMPLGELPAGGRVEWTVSGATAGSRGEILVRAGSYWAWCELVVAEQAAHHAHHHGAARAAPAAHPAYRRPPHDHGERMFLGYEFRHLDNELDRAVYSPQERKILINTAAPTVQLYVDGRGHFRDSARLLLAELFMDVISDELARRAVERAGKPHDAAALHKAKLDIIRRYGSEIHQSFLSG
ncbi:ATP-binding protein [Pseudomonas sp. GCM10022188]|uniref:ATP-binding protein n=1 Tax=Pseudomonas TaxID=286 RepID=UPI001E60B17B|nr:ATP-binding protein [Pseudomonas oryzagri]MCC6077013.1 ATP-binding protein [Pseudomonas oryzagri]